MSINGISVSASAVCTQTQSATQPTAATTLVQFGVAQPLGPVYHHHYHSNGDAAAQLADLAQSGIAAADDTNIRNILLG